MEAKLYCERCGENNLHHRAVDIHRRQVEDAPSESVRAYGADAVDTENPSPRRDGIVIQLYCEMCDRVTTAMDIYQHKGVTHVTLRRVT